MDGEHGAEAGLARPGEVGLVSVAEARAHDPQPTWNRHTAESWALIGKEYQAGATAKQLAVKWGVAPTSIYRHAQAENWSKKARARRVAEEAQARLAAARETPARPPLPLGVAADPATPIEVRSLVLASISRCLMEGRYAEAERLGKLVENLERLFPTSDVVYVRDEAAARTADAEAFRRLSDAIDRRHDALEPILEQAGVSEAVTALIEDYLVRETYR